MKIENANDVGLLAEVRPDREAAARNFLQAFSHVTMVNSAMNLRAGAKRAEQ